MRLSHNTASLNVYRGYSKAVQKQSDAMNKISSGYKVNNAKDDPNVIAQSERMRMQIRGLQMAGKNAQDGVSMLQTAEGGLDSMTSMAQRIRELIVQAGNGANTEEDKKTIQNEIDQMIDGIDDIAKTTEFNGIKLLAEDKILEMPIGANAGESVKIPQFALSSDKVGTDMTNTLQSIRSANKNDGTIGVNNIVDNSIDKALEIVDRSLDKIVSVRSKYGALENRFEGGLQDINEISDIMDGADSNLRDADIAVEMAELAKNNILAEAGNAMMVQTNKFPQDVLRILENVRSK
ncbi:flagellin [Clostridium magnum]|uniref:Flagellin n=1 Tax=Clostridium magnum DSM 2767 TaxID=1121326 RepID=A0A161YST4_9CLOT|nr:flagellin [Clostridium magnum]KZL94132.1 flagellin [Clostridium magnum DSM 2767]SHH94463.1 flagellin [Clostridium magnum DSM 2767]